MADVESFDEKHGSDAVAFLGFLVDGKVFDMTDPTQREMAARVSAFAAITTDERPQSVVLTDANVAAAGKIVEKIIPISL